MIELSIEDLECKGRCLEIFERARQLRGKDKTPLFETETFREVAHEIRQKKPGATDREILAFILRRFAGELRHA